jgi:hypothetical protein
MRFPALPAICSRKCPTPDVDVEKISGDSFVSRWTHSLKLNGHYGARDVPGITEACFVTPLIAIYYPKDW